MNINNVLRYLGLIIAGTGIFMLVPFITSLIYGESEAGAFAVSLVISLVVGVGLWRLIPIKQKGIKQREAILIVVGGWVGASAFGALPYVLSGALPNYLDAFFEALSGYTTTGASVMADIDVQSHSVLIWRSLSQWLGGMGIIMLFVAMFPLLGIGAAHLIDAEMPGQQGEKLRSRIQDTAKVLWLTYMGLTILEVICLLFTGMSFYDAACVTFSTVSIGGFTTTALSIASYNSLAVEMIVMVFMLLAGVNFGLYYYVFWKGQPGKLWHNSEFKLYLALVFGAVLLVNIDLVANTGMAVADALRYGSFNTVSIATTTGFSTMDFDGWPPLSRSLLLVLMVIGASAGSTGGALKVVRVLVLVKYTYRRLRRTFNPSHIIPLKLDGNVIPNSVVSRIISLTIIYLVVLWGGFVAMSALGLDLVTALSAVTASLGNVGPGLGGVGPALNYASIPEIGKGVLILLMLAGRLELFTLMVLFVPSFWKWK